MRNGMGLLLRHLACGVAHFLRGDVFAINFGNDALPRSAPKIGPHAGDQGYGHGPANQQQQCAQDNLLERSFGL
jgi:hypothetical protein